jgi:syndetin
MNLVRELEKDLRIANVICMVSIVRVSTCIDVTFFLCPDLTALFSMILQNGRRHLTSSMNEVSRDLIVNSYSKKKQALVVFPSLFNLKLTMALLFFFVVVLMDCFPF